jgi:polysaccharide biosynthesis/export protein
MVAATKLITLSVARLLSGCLACLLVSVITCAAEPTPSASTGSSAAAAVQHETPRPLIQIGRGDSIGIQVYGQPDMNANLYVSDDGTIPIPLAGAVKVDGLSPAEAGSAIEKSFRDGKILVDPHVTVTVTQSRSQRVSVLGEVHAPGRYPIESNTTILDLLAQAGGTTDGSSETVYIMRPEADGSISRHPINLRGFHNSSDSIPAETLHGGDSLFVPKAENFSIYGEVKAPNVYRLEPNTTIVQAIARAGGITARGSTRRVEIKRKGADGKVQTLKAKLDDVVQADDVIRVEESIF